MAGHWCPIQGHDHKLIGVYSHQRGGDQKFVADTFECPTGYYRWFVLRGRQVSDDIRQKRPRYGWRPQADTHEYTPEPEKRYLLIRTFHYDNVTGEDQRFDGVTMETLEIAVQEGINDAPRGCMGVTFRVVFPS